MKNLFLVMLCLLLLAGCQADLPQEGSSPSSADEESLPAVSVEESYGGGYRLRVICKSAVPGGFP